MWSIYIPLIPVRVKILWLLLGRPPLSRRVNLLPKIRIGERVGAHQVPPTDWEAVIVITTTPRKLFVCGVSHIYHHTQSVGCVCVYDTSDGGCTYPNKRKKNFSEFS
jgi:hypothetical protein